MKEKTVPARSATEFEIRGKMEEWTGWREQNKSQMIGEEKRNGRLVGAAKTGKEHADWRKLQRKNLGILGLLKRKEWSQCHREQLARMLEPPLPKGKGTAVCPKHQIMRGERVKVGKSRTLARKRGSEREHGVERVDFTVNEGIFQGGQRGHATRASLEQVEGSMSG